MKILIYFLTIFVITKVHGIQLSLKNDHENSTQLLFDSSTNRAFCFPHEEVMGLIADDTNHHNWGFSTSWNYTLAIQRVGQVFCRQLGFSFFGSIMPIEIEESRNKILWAASCLGYEALITHCIYEEFTDLGLICKKFVGLRCFNCNNSIYHLKPSETLEITSPGFPTMYTDHGICEWVIKRDVPSPIVIRVSYLSLPRTNVFGHCSNGVLEIRSQNESFSPFVVRHMLCGKSEDEVFVVEDSILSLRLYSGIFHPRLYGAAGFNLTVSLSNDSTTKEDVLRIVNRDQTLNSAEIIGIVFGVLALGILLVPVFILIKSLIIRKRRRASQRSMADTLHVRITPQTPCVGMSVRKAPLPAIPKNGRNQILSLSSDDHNKKSSLESGLYEDINQNRIKNGSYLHLDEFKRRLSLEDAADDGSQKYSFKVPTFVFTPYDDSRSNAPTEDSKSQPSDMPSCLSFGSDLDSVFGDKSFQAPDYKSPERNAAYTVVSKNARNGTFTISPDAKERHSSSPLAVNFWNKRKAEILALQYTGQRRASEPAAKSGSYFDTLAVFPKTRSYKFDTSHLTST